MRLNVALGLSLFITLAASGQEPADHATADKQPDAAASRPSSWIRPVDGLESGDGYAVRYPGDQCIRRDPRTIFSDDFEGRQPFLGWTDRKNPDCVRLAEDVVHSGFYALAIEAGPEADRGGHLFKRLRVGYDELHVRFYAYFPAPSAPVRHFVQITADEPPRPFPLGGAGVCPDGGVRFATAIDPLMVPGCGPPGSWHLHSYWCEMAISSDGKYWGNGFAPAVPLPVATDRWICVEVMVKANTTPNSRDGMQAFWIDGKLAAAYRGFRWRTDPRLKLNGLCLRHYVATEDGAKTGSSLDPPVKARVLFDDVVVATRYIGPQRAVPLAQGMR